MKRLFPIALALLCLQISFAASGQNNSNPAIKSFWSRFQSAVARGDKRAVASMTKYPLGMPYGVRSIKNRAQLIRGYGKIFDAETRRCFATAEPQLESPTSKRFSINCGEAMMYWFEPVNGEYRLTAVDNVNE